MGWFISRTHRWNNSVSLKEVWRAKWISFAPLSKDIKKNAVWALSEDNLSLVSFWLHKQRLPFKELKIKRIQWMVLFPSIPQTRPNFQQVRPFCFRFCFRFVFSTSFLGWFWRASGDTKKIAFCWYVLSPRCHSF